MVVLAAEIMVMVFKCTGAAVEHTASVANFQKTVCLWCARIFRYQPVRLAGEMRRGQAVGAPGDISHSCDVLKTNTECFARSLALGVAISGEKVPQNRAENHTFQHEPTQKQRRCAIMEGRK